MLIGHKFGRQVMDAANDAELSPALRALFQLLFPLVRSGGAVFFMISGYIIMHVIQHENAREFLIKRVFRIYPLYVLAVLVEFAFLFSDGTQPAFVVLLQRVFLVGDFFGTPYALAGVEWTLRVEMAFYLCMALIKAVGLVHGHRKMLVATFFMALIGLWVLGPMPRDLLTGYLTIYSAFLFLGAMTYLLERKEIGVYVYLAFLAFVFIGYYEQIYMYQRRWEGVHFAALGYGIFIAAVAGRRRFTSPALVLILSDLTYAVYLFHNWLYDRIYKVVNSETAAVVLLFIFCAIVVRFFEKPATRLGGRLGVKLGERILNVPRRAL